MADDLDPSLYVRVPIINVSNGISLARALLTASPKGAPAPVRKAARKLRTAATELQEARLARSRAGVVSDARSADKSMDNAVSALHQRLTACTLLSVEQHPLATRAAELLAALFPDGLKLLLLPYTEEWAEVDTLLRRIDADGLAPELDRLAGKEFLAAVRGAFVAYGSALGVTKKSAEVATVPLADPLRSVGRAIAAYATQVVAAFDDSEGDARAALRAALVPLDAHRASVARRREGTAKAEEPAEEDDEAPLPPAPAV